MDFQEETTTFSNRLPVRFINTIEEIAGTHPGQRRAHARGICAKGVFTPSGRTIGMTFAAHLQQEPCEAVIRFSNSAPDPATSDLMSPVKGMAVEFQRPDRHGVKPVIVAATIPVFVTRTPESFHEMMIAARDLAKQGHSFKERINGLLHLFPHAGKALTLLDDIKPPASFVSIPYYSVHAFYFVDESGTKRAVKYEWVPDAEAHMPLIKAAVSSKDYLEDELRERLNSSPAGFTLKLTLGEEGDSVDDCSVSWPSERETIEAGHLSIQQLIEEPDGLLMDPTATGEGIEVTPDPILLFRHDAYAESYRRRQEGC
ncbi:catalase [Paenibacillus pasadenensis]|uniref:catalase n=1 Tax=Paenibacillus pasadenensis TaxID=217090 RepID=UPI00203B3016|nr:catalase [Paenibacillus pasadenensis]MCM3748658.1 catalase [Paenibacillus pasadenensis]